MNLFDDEVVLITGGTGSFGNWILDEVLRSNVAEVRVFSRDEEKQLDLKRKIKDSRLKLILGDVRDYDRVLEACHGVNIVYHAAAQKIIDSCEENPEEALKTNVLGSINVKRACISSHIKKAILLSTDKAVKPINLYGMSKAMAERIWIRDTGFENNFIVVRYGNVLSSRGSVIPFFQQLIRNNKPLPITHPENTRFLITLEQACQLVFYATNYGRNSVVYVPKLPSCRIDDLAAVLGGEDYPTYISGLRFGEKIHECLIQEYEIRITAMAGGYFVINPNSEIGNKVLTEEFTSDKTKILNKTEISNLLKEAKIVP
jgi:UDP-N-acetylglucosamine 4,6-dehydratase